MKKIISTYKFKNFSINKKFTISLFLFLILPLTIVLLWMNYSLISHVNEQNLKTNLEVLKQTQTPIDYMVQDLTYVSLQVLGNENIQQYLSEDSKENQKELLDNIRYDTTQLIENKKYITRLSVFDQDNLYIRIGSYLKEEDTSYIEEAAQLQGKPYWTPAIYEKNYVSSWARTYEDSMIRAINSVRSLNQILGYLKISVSEQYLCSLYNGIQDKGTKELFIMDQNGNIISSMNKDLLETNISDKKYFTKIESMKEGYFPLNPEEYISFYNIDETGWYVLKIDNANNLKAGNLLNSIGLICLILIIVFGIIFYYIQKRHIIAPLKSLSKDVSKFKEGRYQINQYNNSRDEIGVLNQSFIDMSQYIEELIERVYKSKLKEKEAQLSYLQSQINPHFLYNTLDSIRWMAIKEKQYEMADQMEALANLFKHALNQGKEMTTVQEEVNHLRDYLLIQKNKFGDRLQTEIQVDSALQRYPAINLILQPLVENAIVHGIGPKLEGGHIRVNIFHDEKYLYYEVQDDGVGAEESGVIAALNAGNDSYNALALDNINKRIKYKYGEEYGIQFSSTIGSGTTVRVKIPYEEEWMNETINCG